MSIFLPPQRLEGRGNTLDNKEHFYLEWAISGNVESGVVGTLADIYYDYLSILHLNLDD